MKIEFENGSVIEAIDTQSMTKSVRARNTKHHEWAEEEIKNFKNMVKDIKNNLHRFYKH